MGSQDLQLIQNLLFGIELNDMYMIVRLDRGVSVLPRVKRNYEASSRFL